MQKMIWQSTAEVCRDFDNLPEKKQGWFLNEACLEGRRYKSTIDKIYLYQV